jgi:hypothetical protein
MLDVQLANRRDLSQDIDFAIDFSECSWRGLRDSDMAINSLSLIDRRGALGG